MSTTTAKSSIPLVAVSDATLPATVREWKEISAWMETAKKTEKELREKIAAALFPSPVEGVNRVQVVLDGSTVEVALDHKINRKLDEPGLDAVMLQLPEDSPYRQAGVLIAYKPSLVLKGFRTMPDDQRRIFSQCLTETPGLPSLDVEVIEEAGADWPAKIAAPLALGAASSPTKAVLVNFSKHVKKSKPAPAPKKQSAAAKAVKAVQSSRKKKR